MFLYRLHAVWRVPQAGKVAGSLKGATAGWRRGSEASGLVRMVNLLTCFTYILFIGLPSVGFDTDDHDKCGKMRNGLLDSNVYRDHPIEQVGCSLAGAR